MQSVTLAIVVGVGVLLVIITVAGYLQLRQIHRAVNSNMTTALNKIEDLHARVAQLVDEARSRPRAKPMRRKR